MAEFGKRRSNGSKSGSGDGAKGGKKGYKAGRSFTKNKASRSEGGKKSYDKKEGSDRSRFRKSDSDRDFKPKRSFGDKPERPRRSSDDGKAPIERRVFNSDEKGERKFRGERPERPHRSFGDKPERSGRSFDEGKPRGPKRDFADGERRERRSFGDKPERGKRSFDENKSRGPKREFGDGERRERRSFGDKPERGTRSFDDNKSRAPKRDFSGRERGDRSFGEKSGERRSFTKREDAPFRGERSSSREGGERRSKSSFASDKHQSEDFESSKSMRSSDFKDRSKKPAAKPAKQGNDDGLIRLNKYLSNAGIASRREADILIQSGVVKVNGEVVDQLGYKIKPGDKVTYGDSAVKTERKVYMLVNKPKDYITTVDDPRERKTVMELIEGACKERVYPVGRLDRNTTGVLLLTNDGELTTKLTHPKFGVKKVYNVTLNKGLKAEDFRKIIEGIELEDGPIAVDDLAFVGEGKKEIGLEIHSGRNRIVRRIFEHLGYDVIKLDRVVFAGLTKKDLPRGKYRFLTAKEISFLQMIG